MLVVIVVGRIKMLYKRCHKCGCLWNVSSTLLNLKIYTCPKCRRKKGKKNGNKKVLLVKTQGRFF